MGGRRVHIVTTRYNLGLYSDPGVKAQIGCDPDEWMRTRFRLFSTFTLPSLRGQSRQAFRWFLFLDRATPSERVQQLEEAAATYPPMEVVLLRGSVRDFVRGQIAASGAEVAFTSRIDNDDAWDRDYVRCVQEGGYPLGSLVDFRDSYWLEVATRQVYHCTVRWWTDPRWWRFWESLFTPRVSNSPTVVETADDPQTVYASHHRDLVHRFGRRRTFLIPGRPYRLVTCHEHNLLNRVGGREGRFTRASPDVLERFSVARDYPLA